MDLPSERPYTAETRLARAASAAAASCTGKLAESEPSEPGAGTKSRGIGGHVACCDTNQKGADAELAVGRSGGVHMTGESLSRLRFFALLLMLPGLVGLITAGLLSTTYLNSMPRVPDPATMRLVPRNIHGTVVYQTGQEDRRLDALEYSSVGLFAVGLGMGLVYLRKWGIAQAIAASEDDVAAEES